ncbi:MAG TPA: hypothetical protein VN207_12535 [Ktedonobacteraceae bacterium]|nr:hypothetical protein [Ktedonobacteraceae bacterium]
MMSRTERNAFLRRYHYRWKEVKGTWILLGPDGWRVTELEAEQNIEQLQQAPVLSPQAWAMDVIEQRPLVLDTETTRP